LDVPLLAGLGLGRSRSAIKRIHRKKKKESLKKIKMKMKPNQAVTTETIQDGVSAVACTKITV
jgi:hypothetical protein